METIKKLTIDDFKALVTSPDWTRQQYFEEVSSDTRKEEDGWDDDKQEYKTVEVPYIVGCAIKESTLGSLRIIYSELFSFEQYDPDTLETSDSNWQFEGFYVVDEEGEEIGDEELVEYIPEEFGEIDYSDMCTEKVVDVDVDENIGTTTLQVDYAPNIRFSGELVAHVSDSPDQSNPMYSGSFGRWTELELYKTVKGRFICYRANRTQWEGEDARTWAAVAETPEDIKQFFGKDKLAEWLYAKTGI